MVTWGPLNKACSWGSSRSPLAFGDKGAPVPSVGRPALTGGLRTDSGRASASDTASICSGMAFWSSGPQTPLAAPSTPTPTRWPLALPLWPDPPTQHAGRHPLQ